MPIKLLILAKLVVILVYFSNNYISDKNLIAKPKGRFNYYD